MSFARLGLLLVMGACVVGHATVACAETAEELYDRAWAAMEKKDYDGACELFDRSYAQSMATGPLQGLATCFEARGRLKQSLQLWRDAQNRLPAGSPSRPQVAAAIARLSKMVPLLTLKLPDARAASVHLVLDGEVVSLDGAPIELDPIVRHVLVVRMGSDEPTTMDVRLAQGERRTIVIEGPVAASSDRIGPVRGTGIGLTVLGALGLTVAGITSGVMLGQQATVDEGCSGPDHTLCTTAALSASDSAKAIGPWNAASWIVGLAALGAGIPMLIVGDSKVSANAGLLIQPAGAGIFGRF